ncbi:MAG TPA: hypothetical protein VGF48_20775 [Thermoanaerobaculia bacterium]|jgi:hypothetical protein
MLIRSQPARLTFLLAAMVVMVAASASAQVPDVVIVGERLCSITCPTPLYQVEWFGPTYGHRIGPNVFKVVESAPGGRLYALLTGSPSRVVEVLPDGSYTPLTAPLAGFRLIDLTVARNGAFYVLASQGNASPGRILAFDPSGNLVATRNASVGTQDYYRLDLAADQCTLFYTDFSLTTIRRINVCSGAPLPDLATLPGEVRDLRVLPDGGVLVVDVDRGLVRLNAAGVETRTYPLGQVYPYAAIALIDNGATALYGGDHYDSSGTVLGRLDLNSGVATTLTGTASEGRTFSVAARLGWTAAIGASSHGGADVPTLSTWAMLIAVAALGVLALRRL